MISDNGSQFTAHEFQEFSRQWNFKHITSTPTYPQSNRKVEAAVKSAKAIMKKSRKPGSDPLLALLEYRNTPTQGIEASPVMRLISRRTKTRLLVIPALLKPKVDQNVHQQIMVGKAKEALCYCKGAKDLKALRKGDTVRLIPPRSPTKEAVKARVHGQVGNRSYEVVTEDGARYRRNRVQLRKTKEDLKEGRGQPPSTDTTPKSEAAIEEPTLSGPEVHEPSLATPAI